MKDNTVFEKNYEYLGHRYKITHDDFANLIQLEKLVRLKWWQKESWLNGQSYDWITIYHGHISPLRECVEIFDLRNKPNKD